MPTEINGTTGVSQVQAGATSGGLPVFQCRAWVNFDGTRDSTGALSTANTARFIRASGNVSSVVRNGVGDYTVNFTNAMPDANFSVATSVDGIGFNNLQSTATSSVRLRAAVQNGTAADGVVVNAAIFR